MSRPQSLHIALLNNAGGVRERSKVLFEASVVGASPFFYNRMPDILKMKPSFTPANFMHFPEEGLFFPIFLAKNINEFGSF